MSYVGLLCGVVYLSMLFWLSLGIGFSVLLLFVFGCLLCWFAVL